MGLIEKIKAVWNKMFKANDVKNIFGIETGRSSDMETALSLYKNMRSGIPKWCASGKIKPTRFSNTICREIANLTLFNADIQITGNDELKKRFDKVMNALQEKQEESCATCGMMIKSDGDDVEFLDPDYFLITDTNTDGDALAAIFFSYLKKNDKYYTKAEYHRFEDVGLERAYHISSKAFKSDTKDMIGNIVDRYEEVVQFWRNYKMPEEDSIEAARKAEKEISEKLSYLINADAEKAFFEILGPFSPMDDGKIFAEVVLDSVAYVIEKKLNTNVTKVQRRVNKYVAKYHN